MARRVGMGAAAGGVLGALAFMVPGIGPAMAVTIMTASATAGLFVVKEYFQN